MSKYLDAAHAVLRGADGALTANEIVKEASKAGWIKTRGRTPDRTMGAMLYTDIKRGGSRFSQNGPGRFKLSGADASAAGGRVQGGKPSGGKRAGKQPIRATGGARHGRQTTRAIDPYSRQDSKEIDKPSGNDYRRRIGVAGELRVMSELLLRGYNADHITIDNGIDIRATKGGNVYEIQVKTVTELKTGQKFVTRISKEAFHRADSPNTYYVFVLRNRYNGITYVTASNKEVKRMIGDENITTNKAGYQVQFSIRDGSLFLRDEKVDGLVNDWNL